MKNKYRTIPLLGLCVMLVPLFGYAQNSAWDKALDRAVAAKTAQVEVQVKFIKYIKDYKNRPQLRRQNKDIVVERKEKHCVGKLASQKSRVYIPITCVQEDSYHISQVNLTFASGQKIQAAEKDVHMGEDVAFVTVALK